MCGAIWSAYIVYVLRLRIAIHDISAQQFNIARIQYAVTDASVVNNDTPRQTELCTRNYYVQNNSSNSSVTDGDNGCIIAQTATKTMRDFRQRKAQIINYMHFSLVHHHHDVDDDITRSMDVCHIVYSVLYCNPPVHQFIYSSWIRLRFAITNHPSTVSPTLTLLRAQSMHQQPVECLLVCSQMLFPVRHVLCKLSGWQNAQLPKKPNPTLNSTRNKMKKTEKKKKWKTCDCIQNDKLSNVFVRHKMCTRNSIE